MSLPDALEILLQSMQSRNFSVISKVDLQSERQDANDGRRCVIVRALFPRLATAGEGNSSHLFDRIRCSAILQENGVDRVHLELSKPTRLLNPHEPQIAK